MSTLGIAEPRRILRATSVIRLSFGVAGLLLPARTGALCGIRATSSPRRRST